MTLEDNLGDIISKARFITQVEAPAAAKAAGLSDAEYATLEESGKSAKPVNFAALAPLLNLNAAKLQKIANGWVPAETDLSLWREFRCITTSNEKLSVHAYVAWDEVTREAAVFDTGLTAAPMIELIEQEKLTLKHIFITHSHYDHMEGFTALREKFPKAILHTSAKGAPPQHRNRANDFLHLGSLRITNRDTPGHAEDGVTYIVGNFPEDAPSIAIVGDAIFAGSIGGARADRSVALPKIRENILSLPGDTLICSGHGPFSTVDQEKENNPFF